MVEEGSKLHFDRVCFGLLLFFWAWIICRLSRKKAQKSTKVVFVIRFGFIASYLEGV